MQCWSLQYYRTAWVQCSSTTLRIQEPEYSVAENTAETEVSEVFRCLRQDLNKLVMPIQNSHSDALNLWRHLQLLMICNILKTGCVRTHWTTALGAAVPALWAWLVLFPSAGGSWEQQRFQSVLERIWQLKKGGELYFIFVIKISSKIQLVETVLWAGI